MLDADIREPLFYTWKRDMERCVFSKKKISERRAPM